MKRLVTGGLAALAMGLIGAPVAGADSYTSTAAEQNFYSQVYLYAHPSLTDARLLELGSPAAGFLGMRLSTTASARICDST
jgi:hypothetical protein